jgi:hypothetical protein
MTTKDWLDVIIIPVALAFLPLIWGLTGWWIRRVQFQELIFRELEEIGPHPPTRGEAGSRNHWSEHHTRKRFVHTDILNQPTDNRDFILSLSADIVYYVNQLWNSKENAPQWIYMLYKLEKKMKIPLWQIHRRQRVASVRQKWYVLMKEYGEKFDPDFETKYCPQYSDLSEDERERLRAAIQDEPAHSES